MKKNLFRQDSVAKGSKKRKKLIFYPLADGKNKTRRVKGIGTGFAQAAFTKGA